MNAKFPVDYVCRAVTSLYDGQLGMYIIFGLQVDYALIHIDTYGHHRDDFVLMLSPRVNDTTW